MHSIFRKKITFSDLYLSSNFFFISKLTVRRKVHNKLSRVLLTESLSEGYTLLDHREIFIFGTKLTILYLSVSYAILRYEFQDLQALTYF